MRIAGFDEISEADWDSLADGSPEAWLFHRRHWVNIEAGHAVPSHHSFGVIDDAGQLAAICPLYRRDLERGWTERILDTGHHRHAGPAFREGLEPSGRKPVTKFLMQHIFGVAEKHEVHRVLMNSSNLAPVNLSDRRSELPFWVLDYGFHLGTFMGPGGDSSMPGMATAFADQIIDLTKSEEALFSALDGDFRNAVRKGMKSGMSARQWDPATALDTYYNLARNSAERTGESLPGRAYYEDIWNAFSGQGRCHMLFAIHEGIPAGAIMILMDKKAAVFFSGVFHRDYLPMRVSNFLQWEVVRWLKAMGLRRYRLGPLFPSLPADWAVSKVSRIKGDLGGDSYSVIQGSHYRKADEYLRDMPSISRHLSQMTRKGG